MYCLLYAGRQALRARAVNHVVFTIADEMLHCRRLPLPPPPLPQRLWSRPVDYPHPIPLADLRYLAFPEVFLEFSSAVRDKPATYVQLVARLAQGKDVRILNTTWLPPFLSLRPCTSIWAFPLVHSQGVASMDLDRTRKLFVTILGLTILVIAAMFVLNLRIRSARSQVEPARSRESPSRRLLAACSIRLSKSPSTPPTPKKIGWTQSPPPLMRRDGKPRPATPFSFESATALPAAPRTPFWMAAAARHVEPG